MSEATATAKGRPAVYGVSDEAEDMLSTLSVSVDDLSDGILSDIDCVLIGVEAQRGGEEREIPGQPGEFFTTQDQMIWHLRVDNAFDLGLESDVVQWYFNLPREIQRDGQRNRADPPRNSDYGTLLQDLEGLGVSANPTNAALYHFTRMRDLTGLHFHREQKDVEDRSGRKRRQYRITGLYGIENSVREEVGLPPAYLNGQEPAVAAAGGRSKS